MSNEAGGVGCIMAFVAAVGLWTGVHLVSPRFVKNAELLEKVELKINGADGKPTREEQQSFLDSLDQDYKLKKGDRLEYLSQYRGIDVYLFNDSQNTRRELFQLTIAKAKNYVTGN